MPIMQHKLDTIPKTVDPSILFDADKNIERNKKIIAAIKE